MTFQSIRNYFLVSLLAVQFTNAQTPARVSSSQTLQEQGSQEQKTDRPSGNSESAATEKASIPDPLVNLLVSKGLLTAGTRGPSSLPEIRRTSAIDLLLS